MKPALSFLHSRHPRVLPQMLGLLLTFGCQLLLISGAHAEKADASKPLNISSNALSYDDVRQINTFTGNVVITRGTLLMKGEKAVVVTDAAGYRIATLYAGANGQATFRQKRDGGPDLWIDGHAKRIEYSDKTEIVQLFNTAEMRRLTGTRPTDQVNGEYISYDSRSEFYTVNNSADPKASTGDGRVHVLLQPRTDTDNGSNNADGSQGAPAPAGAAPEGAAQ